MTILKTDTGIDLIKNVHARPDSTRIDQIACQRVEAPTRRACESNIWLNSYSLVCLTTLSVSHLTPSLPSPSSFHRNQTVADLLEECELPGVCVCVCQAGPCIANRNQKPSAGRAHRLLKGPQSCCDRYQKTHWFSFYYSVCFKKFQTFFSYSSIIIIIILIIIIISDIFIFLFFPRSDILVNRIRLSSELTMSKWKKRGSQRRKNLSRLLCY